MTLTGYGRAPYCPRCGVGAHEVTDLAAANAGNRLLMYPVHAVDCRLSHEKKTAVMTFKVNVAYKIVADDWVEVNAENQYQEWLDANAPRLINDDSHAPELNGRPDYERR